ncbi:tripartite motif-containing protein 67-like [Saccostrea cucullata]|uniref:tripartite motif-containing protein 67-like n=1 Tax=Saccostrea cuccullata TaxID=36930 RepID=UPI002ED4D91B
MNPRTSAQDVIRCDLCKIAVVQMHCTRCLANLCKVCGEEHISTNESKDHKIVKFQARKSTLLYPGCTTHDKEQCEMFCKKCDIPVCISCLGSNQHLGHALIKVLQVVGEKKDTILRERNEIKDKIYPTFQEIAYDKQTKMSQLKKDYGDLSTAITEHGEDWHREIDKLVKTLKAEVAEMKNTQLQTLQKQLDEINKKISDIKDDINLFEMALDTNDLSKLFSVTSNIKTYKTSSQQIMTYLPTFIPNKLPEELNKLFGALSASSLTSDQQGNKMKTTQKSQEAISSPPVKELLDEPENVTTINTDYTNLYNVACLSDEEIWTKGDDNNMKLYSINQGSLLSLKKLFNFNITRGSRLKSITTKSGYKPTDIAVTKSGDLVFMDYIDRTVIILQKEKFEEVIKLQNWRPYSVCSTSSGDLLVLLDSDDAKQAKVVHYSGSTEKQTIQFDDHGKPLYSPGGYYRYITENKNLDICVSDSVARAVVIVNQAGKLRFKYTGYTSVQKNKPFSPRGIATDSISHILTADYNNGCVHLIDQDGQFLRYIDCGLNGPWGLCTDTNDNLLVAQCMHRQVKKIKYLQRNLSVC